MKKNILVLITCAAIMLGGGSAACAGNADTVKSVPVQHEGRVKSFDAFARHVLEIVQERDHWEKKPAARLLMEAAADPGAVADWAWIRVDHRELALRLGLPEGRHSYSFNEIFPSAGKIEQIARDAQAKRDEDKTPTLFDRKAEALYGALLTTRRVIDGSVFRVLPPRGPSSSEWGSPFPDSEDELAKPFRELASAGAAGHADELRRRVASWNHAVDTETRGRWRRQITLEGVYLDARPFRWAWIAYLAAFAAGLAAGGRRRILTTAAILAGTGFLLHTAGLVLRILILSRPPVSNMYESMVYMNWVVMTAAIVFSLVRRNRVPIHVGSLLSAAVMIYGDLLPIDQSLDVLVPVLRSNYWLTIHVLTIVSSYGIFGLAMALGHRHLWFEATGGFRKRETAEQSASMIIRCIQIGVLLLGIGTVLGGVWANESWGRFWGWDPKETWALITFLGYAVLIHLHYARLVSAFGLALSSVGGFLLVLMTWYGVNFVLGKGLHSYGQGSGGMMWVVVYLLAEAAFAAFVLARRPRKHRRAA